MLMRCLECGNKAKKDCLYFRCRSCCRGREFECQSHVKSTWVPISTRQVVRNLSMVAASSATPAAGPSHHHHHQPEERQLLADPHQSSFGFEGQFPAEVSGEATFTCVRVTTSLEENAIVEQYAYETSINIRGHLFKGVLYDQGPNLPMVNSNLMIVHDRDRRHTTNIDPNFQPVNNFRSSVSSTLSGYSHGVKDHEEQSVLLGFPHKKTAPRMSRSGPRGML